MPRTQRARLLRRLTGAALAVCMSWSAAGLPAAAPLSAASCCCKERGAACHCPACEHARDLSSSQAHLRSCASGAPDARGVAVHEPFTLPAALHPWPARRQRPRRPLPAAGPRPDLEVPTPPPLA